MEYYLKFIYSYNNRNSPQKRRIAESELKRINSGVDQKGNAKFLIKTNLKNIIFKQKKFTAIFSIFKISLLSEITGVGLEHFQTSRRRSCLLGQRVGSGASMLWGWFHPPPPIFGGRIVSSRNS